MKTDPHDDRVKRIFSKRLREYMAAHEISISQLAAAVNADESTVRRWRKGDTAPKSLADLSRVADAVGVPVEILLSEDPDRFESGRRAMVALMRRQLERWERPREPDLPAPVAEPIGDGEEKADSDGA